jgi:uncharacterized protein
MDEATTLDFITRRLSSRREVRRILLFGSRARGDARAASDFDLCIIVDGVDDERTLYVELMRDIASADWSIDLLIMTEEDFARKLEEDWSLLRDLERDGKVLYAA